jgi:competence protein ComEA
MQTSNLPTNLVVLFLFLIAGSALLSGCTSRKITRANPVENARSPAIHLININTATEAELIDLPHVGPSLAKKIIQHRETYGPFRRPEHLLVIDGLSEKRFLEFRQFINTE